MKAIYFLIFNIVVFIASACLSKGEDIFMVIGIISMLLIPIFLVFLIFKKIKTQFCKKFKNQIDNLKPTPKNNADSIAALERRNKSKYQQYNYSHERLYAEQNTSDKNKSDIELTKYDEKRLDENSYMTPREKSVEELKLEQYRKENQTEFLNKLKTEFYEEQLKKPNFEDLKHCIFAENEDDFEWNNDYFTDEHQSCREYFLIKNKWCFFDYDDERKLYKLVVCDNKIFYTYCYIDSMTSKTKKLLNFIQNNSHKHAFYEADLKNNSKILTTGVKIACENCGYTYNADNKKCPNCHYLTKDILNQ